MAEIEEILQTRETTHGDYVQKSVFIQKFKYKIRECPNWRDMSSGKKEALDNIIQKMARILHGDLDFEDHWDDIAGYAKLALREG